MKKIKVLYAGIKYHYNRPKFGLAYDYLNYYETFKQMKTVSVEEFDWVREMGKLGSKREMNLALLRRVDHFKPDLVFFTLYKDEYAEETIWTISQKTLTFNWFADDIGRLETYLMKWIPLFSWVSVITPSSFIKLKAVGFTNIIQTCWGANIRIYKKLNLKKIYPVSFIGQAHGNRKRLIEEIRNRDIDIKAWGWKFPSGHINTNHMVRICNQTKINLNFTPISFNFPIYIKFLPWVLQPGTQILETGIKGLNARIFEITAAGGFLLTGSAPDIDNYFKIGKEIVVYENFNDLIERIKFYLDHDQTREKIANAGYIRTLRDHTYEKRYIDIFRKIGL